MLHNDGRIGHERPKLVGLQAWIALEVVQERLFISVIIGNCACQKTRLDSHSRD